MYELEENGIEYPNLPGSREFYERNLKGLANELEIKVLVINFKRGFLGLKETVSYKVSGKSDKIKRFRKIITNYVNSMN